MKSKSKKPSLAETHPKIAKQLHPSKEQYYEKERKK